MNMDLLKIKGKIITGRGKATSDLIGLDSILDIKLEKGSLNLVLSEPLLLNKDFIDIYFDNDKRFLWSITIDGSNIPIYLYRWDGTPLHIVELVSTVNIRNNFDLKDNNQLEILIKKRHIKRVGLLARLSWVILWWKREDWYYTKNTYKKFIQNYFKIIY